MLNQRLSERPRWRGEPLGSKRLLVWGEQGLGDCIMMLRYLPELRARGVDSVVVLCDPSLGRLVGTMAVAESVVTTADDAGAIEFDAHCPMMSLPWVFETRIETIHGKLPYVSVPESMLSPWRTRLTAARPKVGLVWAGSRTLADDARRSIPLQAFIPLLSMDQVEWLSLQKGEKAQEWGSLRADGSQWIEECKDFLDTAALVMNLDLVISVDTAVAHLAGALGKPVWLLSRFESEWRWGLGGTATPWYPTLQILREPGPCQWSSAIEKAVVELGHWIRR